MRLERWAGPGLEGEGLIDRGGACTSVHANRMSPDFPFLDWKGEARFSPHTCPLPVICLWGCHLLSFPLLRPSTVHPQCHCLPWHLCRPMSVTSPRPHIQAWFLPLCAPTVSRTGVSSAGICCWSEQSGAIECQLCARFCAGHCPCLPKVLVSWGRHF